MNKINKCLKCGFWLSYDGDGKEWYCSECDYTEQDSWDFKNKYKVVRDE